MPWIPKKSQEPIKKPPRVTNPVVEKGKGVVILMLKEAVSKCY